MADILSQILAYKRKEVEATKQMMAPKVLREMAELAYHVPVSMHEALLSSPTGIIAECKRRSPSKGEIRPMADAGAVVSGYEDAGAAACSVLTDAAFFGGSLADLAIARRSASLPLLRKDFIVDEYQIWQARVFGADAILLIASALTKAEIARFTAEAHRLGLEVLLELHGEDELSSYIPEVDMVGVNNRNLKNFVTSTDVAKRMASLLPEDAVKVAESGIKSRADLEDLRRHGFSGFLIGETFMKTPCPGQTLKNFINEQ